MALDEGCLTAEALPSGPRAGLSRRKDALAAALEPCGPQRAAPILATLAGMAFRGEPSREMMAAIAKQDLADLADLPEWAIVEAARAYRLGSIGDGRWRPSAGELRVEALRRVEPHARELARIERVLRALVAMLPAPRASPEQRAAVLSGLRGLAARLEGV